MGQDFLVQMEEFNLPDPLHLPTTPAPLLESLILETTFVRE